MSKISLFAEGKKFLAAWIALSTSSSEIFLSARETDIKLFEREQDI